MRSTRGISSVGRAFEWHSKGQEFDSPMLHESRLPQLAGGGFLFFSIPHHSFRRGAHSFRTISPDPPACLLSRPLPCRTYLLVCLPDCLLAWLACLLTCLACLLTCQLPRLCNTSLVPHSEIVAATATAAERRGEPLASSPQPRAVAGEPRNASLRCLPE